MIRSTQQALRATVIAAGAAAALLAPALAVAQEEPAAARRATAVREAPSDTARSIATLAAQAPVTRLPQRQGAWVQVRTEAGAVGWVHMFDVGPAQGAGAGIGQAATGALRGVTNLFVGRGAPRPSTATSTIGIRGLGAEEIANAVPNAAAVAQMESLRQSEANARDFARRASLAAVDVPALAEPGLPRAGTASGGSAGDPARGGAAP